MIDKLDINGQHNEYELIGKLNELTDQMNLITANIPKLCEAMTKLTNVIKHHIKDDISHTTECSSYGEEKETGFEETAD